MQEPCHITTSNITVVIGVFSHDGHAVWQRVLIETLQVPRYDMRMCIVLRSPTIARTKYVNHTTVFVPCPKLGRRTGPLCSLVRWFQTATRSFPNSRLIAKADDDAVWHPMRLLINLRSVIQDENANLYWGMQETYHWDFSSESPVGFSNGPATHSCENGSLYGPFTFAKGPLFAVSSNVIRKIIRTPTIINHAQNIWLHDHEKTPWEDVWFGLALIMSNMSSLHIYHIDNGPFYERWGWFITPSTFVWHMKYKIVARIKKTFQFMDFVHRNWKCQKPTWRLSRFYTQHKCAGTETTVMHLRHNHKRGERVNLKSLISFNTSQHRYECHTST